jgi:hypothetical protein
MTRPWLQRGRPWSCCSKATSPTRPWRWTGTGTSWPTNRMVPHLLEGADASLLEGPVNVLRLSLHPQGLAPRIANLLQWRDAFI